MRENIDDAFGGQPFLPGIPPDAPLNIRRWNAYFKQHAQVTTLQRRAVELWQLACGLKQKDNWIPLLMEQMRHKAAARSMRTTSKTGIAKPQGSHFAKRSH
jgi:hypothetical protein